MLLKRLSYSSSVGLLVESQMWHIPYDDKISYCLNII